MPPLIDLSSGIFICCKCGYASRSLLQHFEQGRYFLTCIPGIHCLLEQMGGDHDELGIDAAVLGMLGDLLDASGPELGLPISRSLVRAHGGELWVDSQRGEGSAFFFTLPVAPHRERTT